MHPLALAVGRSDLLRRVGRITAVRGQILESAGPVAQVGEICAVEAAGGARQLEAEVLGFARGMTILMPAEAVEGIGLGERVVATGRLPGLEVGDALLGRVIDGYGRPLDELGPIAPPTTHRSLRARPSRAMLRTRVSRPLETGIKLIDTMLTLARGQRIGLFAGSGVGKSSLMGALARGARADVIVVALIGERSREVREFVEDQLGREGRGRSVVVVATSAEPAVARLKAALAATAIAEHFCEQGRDVLLLMDSLTRFAMARRELGLAVGEPPTARGYTPSVFSELPQLCERSGPGQAGGSITGVYTVLVEGDDFNEPISDAVRGTLDGHIVLSRDIANEGRYPAIDVLRSVSRLHAAIGQAGDLAAARKLLACCALYQRNRQLIEVGAHKPGLNPALDLAIRVMPEIDAFFAQPADAWCDRDAALVQLRRLAALIGASHDRP